jgi:glycine/D-amino acid oxidase-like deaminating enzyme
VTGDAVVIGCGIVGASAALELSRRGWRVSVFEREAGPGLGSTKFSSSVIRCHYSHAEGVKLAFEGLRIWQDWAKHLGIERPRAWFRPVGVLFIFEGRGAEVHEPGALGLKSEMSSAEMRRRATMMKKLGVRIEFLRAGALKRRFPNLIFDDEVALYELDSGYVVYPKEAAEDIVEAGRRAGIAFAFQRQVVGLAAGEKKKRHRVLVETKEGRMEEVLADVVVNAAGPHAAGLNLAFQVPLGLNTVPLRQYIVRGRYSGRRVPTMGDLVNGFYCRPDPDVFKIGAVLPADHREFEAFPGGTATEPLLSHHLERMLERARRRIKGFELRDAACELAYYDWTVADSYPIIDRTDVDGYYVAIGTSGSWFKGGPVIGELVAELVERVQKGADHDEAPLRVKLLRTGNTLDLGAFSRRRKPLT